MVIAACSSGDGVETADPTTTTVDARTVDQLNAYIAEAAAFDQAAADAQFPDGLEFSAGGAPGYSRYVFREHSEGVVPTLVEGPLGDQVRCLDTDLPCSMDELVELHQSGAPIPTELEITPDELAELVDQLQQLRAFALEHADVNAACAAGFTSDRIQTANMGSHFYKPEWIVDGRGAEHQAVERLDRLTRLEPVEADAPAVLMRRRRHDREGSVVRLEDRAGVETLGPIGGQRDDDLAAQAVRLGDAADL